MAHFRKAAGLSPALAAAMVLGACSYGNVGPAETQSEASMRDATRFLESSRRPFEAENLNRVRTSDGVWTGSVARRNDRGAPLPRQWERPQGFVLKRATPMQLFEIGAAVTEITGIPVNFSSDVMPPVTGMPGAAPVPGAGVPGIPGAPPVAGAPGGDLNALLSGMGIGAPPGLSGNAANVVGGVIRPVTSTRMAMRVDFEGRLSQFMNQVSAHFGTGWEFSGGEIRVFRNMTRTFTVQALPSSIQLTSALTADNSTGQASGGGGGSGGSGASSTAMSNQRVNTSMNIQIWDDITRSVQSIVDNQGRVNASVSTGTITVTAPPSIMSRVQDYLNGMNDYLGRQVTVGITVLSVELTDGDNNVVDVGGLFSQAGRFGISLGTPAGVSAGTAAIATLAQNALDVAAGNAARLVPAQGSPLAGSANAGGGVGFNVANPNSRWNGTNALVQALSTRGRVSVRTTTSVTTLNGVPAPVQVANTRGYVQSVAVSDAASSGGIGSTTRTTIQTSTLTTGFSSSILPRIDTDSESVLLQYSINLSELVGSVNGFDTFTSPDNRASVQLPNVNSRNFVQQARVPNGATLVLTGFEQNANRADRTGSFGDPTFLGLGGRQIGNRGRTAIVILMTPTVVTNQVIRAE